MAHRRIPSRNAWTQRGNLCKAYISGYYLNHIINEWRCPFPHTGLGQNFAPPAHRIWQQDYLNLELNSTCLVCPAVLLFSQEAYPGETESQLDTRIRTHLQNVLGNNRVRPVSRLPFRHLDSYLYVARRHCQGSACYKGE